MNEILRELTVSYPEWDADRVSVQITLDGRTTPVWFTTPKGAGRQVDFLLPLTLFPAMATGCSLKLPGIVSSELLSAVPKIQDIVCRWDAEHWGPGFQRIPVNAAGVRDGHEGRAPGVACFFSGGIDSLYSVLKHRHDITHLIFLHGFDIALADKSLRAQASHMAHEVASELGKTLIEVETNIRAFSDALVDWGAYHGAALASAALLFQHLFRKILIPASFTYADLFPWGSHPLLDPLWSTELTDIEHDGSEATRVDKVAYISRYDIAMKWLRVCWENPHGAYNCGRCEKCMRTMVNLRAVGALEKCRTLPHNIDLQAIASMHLHDETELTFVRHNVTALEKLGTDPDLVRALTETMRRSPEDEKHRKEQEIRSQASQAAYLRAQLERSEEQLRRLEDRLRAIEDSRTWRLFGWYRRLRAKTDALARRS